MISNIVCLNGWELDIKDSEVVKNEKYKYKFICQYLICYFVFNKQKHNFRCILKYNNLKRNFVCINIYKFQEEKFSKFQWKRKD